MISTFQVRRVEPIDTTSYQHLYIVSVRSDRRSFLDYDFAATNSRAIASSQGAGWIAAWQAAANSLGTIDGRPAEKYPDYTKSAGYKIVVPNSLNEDTILDSRLVVPEP